MLSRKTRKLCGSSLAAACVVLAVAIFGAHPVHADLNDGLVGYWKLDGGVAVDYSGNGNDLINHGAVGVSGVSGIGDTALDFQNGPGGENDYLYISDADQSGLDIAGNMTVSAWVNFSSFPANGDKFAIVAKYNEGINQRSYFYSLYNDNGNYKLQAILAVSGTTAFDLWSPAITVATGTWYHFSWVYAPSLGRVDFYVDGSSVGSVSGAPTSLYNSNVTFQIGGYDYGYGPYYFDGAIDEVRIYNRTLTPEEVRVLYELDKPQAPDIENGLVGYWKLDGGAAADYSGNGNDLVNHGAVSTQGVSGEDDTAFHFTRNGSQYFSISDAEQQNLDITGNLTASAWIKTDSQPNDYNIITGKWYGNNPIYDKAWMLTYYNDGINGTKLGFFMSEDCINNNGIAAVEYTLMPDTWYHVAVVYNTSAGHAELFVDGSSIGSFNGLPDSICNSGAEFRIGAADSPPCSFWDGSIDGVRVYNRVLTPEEVMVLYELDKPQPPEPDEPFSFAHMTDIHIGSNWLPKNKWKEELSYPRFTDGLYEIGKMGEKPDFILVSGDIVEYARARWLIDYQSMVNSFTSQSGIPVYTVPGNHDRYEQAWGNAKCRLPGADGCDDGLNNYRTIVNIPGPGLDADDYLYPGNPVDYKFEHKGMTFVGLDSGADFMPDYELGDMRIWDANEQGPEGDGLTAAQINALDALNTDDPKIAFFHHPVMTGRSDECDGDGCPDRLEDGSFANYYDEFLQFAASSSLRLALSGHTHASRVFDIEDTEYTAGAPEGIRPLFVQTQSATKDGGDAHGYRFVDVEAGEAYPRLVSETGNYKKMVGRLRGSDRLTFRVYDPNNPSNFITLENTAGLSVPYFIASSSKRVIVYDFNDNISKLSVAGRENGSSERYDLEARLEGEILPVSAYAGDTGYYLPGMAGEPFLRLFLAPDKNTAKADLKNMEMENIDIHAMLVDWDEVMTGGADGIDLDIDRAGDGSVDETAAFSPMPEKLAGEIAGWAELNIIDESGRITGAINGEPYEEIPYGLYDEENDKAVIYFKDGYSGQPLTFRIRGIENVWGDEGETYTLDLVLIKDGEEIAFRAADIPASASSTHIFTIDWEKLAAGGNGAALKADNDGDGFFELEIRADSELSAEEYLAGSPRRLHERVIVDLEAAKVGRKNVDNKIDEVLKCLRESVNGAYWNDDYHLNGQKGKKVFDADRCAVAKIKLYLGLDDIFDRKKRMRGFWQNKFGLPESVEIAFEQALDDLVLADGMLARLAVNEMPSGTARERAAKKLAEKELERGDAWAENRPWLALMAYEQAWKTAVR